MTKQPTRTPDFDGPAAPCEPVDDLPHQSRKKLAVLAARAKAGQDLFHPADSAALQRLTSRSYKRVPIPGSCREAVMPNVARKPRTGAIILAQTEMLASLENQSVDCSNAKPPSVQSL
jgi:hypothetical protein